MLGGVAGSLITRALGRRRVLGVYGDSGGTQVESGPPSRTARRLPRRIGPPSYPCAERVRRLPPGIWRAIVLRIARSVGVATMFVGLLSACSGVLLCAVEDRSYDFEPWVLFALGLSATLIAVGFVMWSASARLQYRSAGPMQRGR